MPLLKKICLLLGISLLAFSQGNSQKYWTLEECINYALRTNLTVQQSQAQLSIARNNYHQSKLGALPVINGSASHNYNFGRSIDPFTNTFAVQQIQSNNFSLNGNVTLFNGLQVQNTIKQQKSNQEAAQADLETSKNTIALSVANAFLQVVLNEELVAINKAQISSTQEQLDRAGRLVEAGRAAANTELDIRAQLASEKLNLITAENQVKLAYINLWQLMVVDPNDSDKVVKPKITQDFEGLPMFSSSMVYSSFSAGAPQLKAAQSRINSSLLAHKIAMGTRSPRLSLNASISTLYSQSFKTLGGYQLIGSRVLYIDNNNNPVVAPYEIPTSSSITPFGDQLNNNLGKFIGLNLSIPIFSGGQISNAISNAKENIKVAELNLQQAQNSLYLEVSTAVTEYEAAKARYTSAMENLEAQQKSFDFATARYDAGLMNYAEYGLIKNNFARAELTLAQARYELLFRMKTIEFYNTGTITQ